MALYVSILGALLLAASVGWLRRLERRGGPLRAGPWPGLTSRGTSQVLAAALLIGGGQLLLAPAELSAQQRAELPWLPLVALAAALGFLVAAATTGIPGAAAAACGAYLLPRSVLSLLVPELDPPALLIPSATACELALWTRARDLQRLSDVWPRKGNARLKRVWQARGRSRRAITPRRAMLAGAVSGVLLALIEPAQALVLGGPGPASPLAYGLTIAASGVVSAVGARAALAWLAGHGVLRVAE